MIGNATPGGAVVGCRAILAPSPEGTVRRASSAASLLSSLSCLVLLACGESATQIVEIDDGSPSLADAQIRLVGGAVQEGEVASLLPQPLIVEVRDAGGQPFRGAPVEWVFQQGAGAADGGSSMPSDTVKATTNAEGRSAIRWRLGTAAGDQEATVAIVVSDASTSPGTGSGQAPGHDKGKKVGFRAHATPGAVDAVSIAPEELTLVEGDSVQLQADVQDKFGNDVEGLSVQWASSDETVAVASETGMVRTVSEGTAEITASAGDTEGSVPLTSTSVVTAVGVSPPGVTMTVGDTVRFSASAVDGDGQPVGGLSVAWATSDSTIVRVDGTGLVTGLAAGSASAIATVGGVSGSQSVTVQAPAGPQDPSPVSDLDVVAFTTSSVTLRWTQVDDGVGGAADYAIRFGSPILSWAGAYLTEVTTQGTQVGTTLEQTWNGLAMGTSYQFQLVPYRGTLNVDAVFGNRSNVVSATTDHDVASVVASPDTVIFRHMGDTIPIVASAKNALGDDVPGITLEFSSSDPNIVEVDSMGRMRSHGLGAAVIAVSAICCGEGDSVIVQVNGEADTLSITVVDQNSVLVENLLLEVGDTARLDATALNAIGHALGEVEPEWDTSNPNVASVSNAGVVTTLAAGNTNIIASYTTASAVLTATVPTIVTDPGTTPPPPPPPPPPPLPPPSGLHPNEPSSMTVIGNADGSIGEAGGSAFGIADFGGWTGTNGGSHNVSVVDDAGNPTGSGKAVRFTWNPLYRESATADMTLSGGPWTELYIMHRVVIESDWADFGHKWFYLLPVGENIPGAAVWTSQESNNSLRVIDGNDHVLVDSGTGSLAGRGSELAMEYHFIAESSPGADDGEVYVYLNGTLIGSSTNLAMAGSGYSNAWGVIHYYGQANIVPSLSHFRVREFYVSGK